jgi:hypothetical protein
MSVPTVAVTLSPTLFLSERTSDVVLAVRAVPAARPLLAAGAAGAGAGVPALDDAVGVVALGVVVRGDAAGRLVLAGVGDAGAAVLAVSGRSLSWAVVSTGASCRSRLRLSAAAVSRLSPRLQAATAVNVSAAMIVLDI